MISLFNNVSLLFCTNVCDRLAKLYCSKGDLNYEYEAQRNIGYKFASIIGKSYVR